MKKLIFLLVFAALAIATISVTVPAIAQDTGHVATVVVDSSTVQHLVDDAITKVGQTGVTVFGWHTSWLVLILTILVVLEVITRMIPGATPFNKWITDSLKYINEHWNKK